MNDLMRHRGEILRALANHKYEANGEGGVLLNTGLTITPMGVFDTVCRRGGEVIWHDLASNLVVTQGLDHILSVVLNGGSQVTTWYVAPFEANYTPVAGLTAATFTASATECTAYDESTRVAYVEAAPSGGVITNSASRAVFTINASKTLYGAALLSASAKSSTSGTLLAAARFSSSRAVVDNDEVACAYSLTLTSS